MIQMFMEPRAQDIRHRLRQIPPPPFRLGVNRVAHDPKIRLLRMPHHRRRHLLRITLVRHGRVSVRRLRVHHRRVRFWIPSVCHGAWYLCRLAGPIIVRKGVGPWCHPAVWGISFPLGHGLQVSDRWEDGTRSSHGHGVAHWS